MGSGQPGPSCPWTFFLKLSVTLKTVLSRHALSTLTVKLKEPALLGFLLFLSGLSVC